jgi:hypothetical protein
MVDVVMVASLLGAITYRLGYRRGKNRELEVARERQASMLRHPSNHLRIVK